MKPTLHERRRAKLVAALRSVKYKQGRDRLRSGDDYCCHGVACDVSKLGRWEKGPGARDYSYDADGDMSQFRLPSMVMKHYGWSDPDGRLTVRQRDGYFPDLTDLNDRGFTFSQIADLIEAGLVEEVK